MKVVKSKWDGPKNSHQADRCHPGEITPPASSSRRGQPPRPLSPWVLHTCCDPAYTQLTFPSMRSQGSQPCRKPAGAS